MQGNIEKAKAAGTIAATLGGMIFFNHGQWSGLRNKLDVHLRRGASESPDSGTEKYYQKLMNNPAELQNTLNNLKNSQNGIDAEGGITIVPDPYCCVKVQDDARQKVFLNLCSSDKVDPPKEHGIEVKEWKKEED